LPTQELSRGEICIFLENAKKDGVKFTRDMKILLDELLRIGCEINFNIENPE